MNRNIIIGVIILLILPYFAKGDEPEAQYARWNLEISQSYYYSTNSLFKDVYGQAYPTYIGLGYQPKERFKLLFGLRFFRKGGQTVMEPPANIPPTDVTLTNYVLPFDMYYAFDYGKIKPYMVVGVNYSIYKETWKDVPISHTKKGLGYEAGAGLIFYTRSKLSFSSGLLFSSSYIKEENDITSTNLSGMSIFLHLAYALK